MMKIFTSSQIHELDKYTIENEPISSIDLMERAARALTQAIMDTWDVETPVVVFAGPALSMFSTFSACVFVVVPSVVVS